MTDAKPATDEEITAIRMTLPEQAHQMSPAAMVMQLIARIDTERARVKVLEEAAIATVYRGELHWVECKFCGATSSSRGVMAPIDLHIRRHMSTCPLCAALKEPANG